MMLLIPNVPPIPDLYTRPFSPKSYNADVFCVSIAAQCAHVNEYNVSYLLYVLFNVVFIKKNNLKQNTVEQTNKNNITFRNENNIKQS